METASSILVVFPDARRALVSLYSVPAVGEALEADVPGMWTVSQIRLEPGEFDGKSYPYEILVEPAEPAATALRY